MTEQLPQEPMLYLDWFVDQYDVGLPNEAVFSSCIAYLQGLIDANRDGNVSNLHQCQSTIRSAEVIVRTLKQYQVRMPYG